MSRELRYKKSNVQGIIDQLNGQHSRKVDAAVAVCYGIMIALVLRVVIQYGLVFRHPVVVMKIPPGLHAVLLIVPLVIFILAKLGHNFGSPPTRVGQFIFISGVTAVLSVGYLMETTNEVFVNWLTGIKNVQVIPAEYLAGNIRFITLVIPAGVILPLLVLCIRIAWEPKVKKQIAEFTPELMKPTVYDITDYTCDIVLCEDVETGKKCIVPEKKLNEHLLGEGGTGSGKTATFIKPILVQLYRQKAYLISEQKRCAYEALEKGLAVVKGPITNDELNENFTMDYITYKEGKKDEYIESFGKMIIGVQPSGNIVYRDLGVTVIAPDGGLPADNVEIAKRFGIRVEKIDPSIDEINKGIIARMNPLKGKDAEKKGDIVSSILSTMESADGQKSKGYFENASVRAVRNTAILLKKMYPAMYNTEPTLEHVLECLNNFHTVIPMVERMKADPELRKKHKAVIDYFETSFFPVPTNAEGKPIFGSQIGSKTRKTEEAIGGVINQLDNFIGRDEVKHILCNAEDSIDLAELLLKGKCLSISTRQNELGERLGKAFALFFILSIQNEVLSRLSEDEGPEIPHFLIIDEFPFYVNEATEVFFTLARKYRCSCMVFIQNMGQLKKISDEFAETIFTNTSTKILFSKSNVEDRKYWAEYFGTEDKFELQTGVTTTAVLADNPSYSEQRRGTIKPINKVSEQEIQELEFKKIYYAYTDFKEAQRIGKGMTADFVKIKELKADEYETYNFNPFLPRVKASVSKEIVRFDKAKEDKNLSAVTPRETKHIDIDSLELEVEQRESQNDLEVNKSEFAMAEVELLIAQNSEETKKGTRETPAVTENVKILYQGNDTNDALMNPDTIEALQLGCNEEILNEKERTYQKDVDLTEDPDMESEKRVIRFEYRSEYREKEL